jgi:DNA invertase Pin-like site-specific DNA recombinase
MLTALDEMSEAGVRLYSVEESLDTADPRQQFNSGPFALLAQQSSDLTSERIKGNKQRAKELGLARRGHHLLLPQGDDGRT